MDLDNILLVERFGVEQLDSEGNLKIRPIDNYRSNGANDQTVAWESVSNDREDTITEAILRLKQSLQIAGEDDEVLIGLEDYVGAYRTLPPSQHQRWLMQLLVWDTDNDEWKVCELTAMPFGAIGGVLAWWRVARGLRSICRNILQLIIFYYVDDTHLVERGRTATSGKEAFQRLMRLLGWELDPGKSTNMCTQVTSLGCSLTITKDDVRWALTPAKRDRWKEVRALQTNQLSSTEASKLHGRLNFGSQRVFGRVGRAALRPICFRQTQHSTLQLGEHLRSALIWWARFLDSWPRTIRTVADLGNKEADYILYTDAEGQGGVGAVLVHGQSEEVLFCKGMIPKHLVKKLQRRRTQINLFELLAVWAAVRTFRHWLQGKSTVLFIDNQSALNMCIKGHSPCQDANLVLHELWLDMATSEISCDFHYVESKCNLADAPSRDSVHQLMHLQGKEVPFDWPEWPRDPKIWMLGPGCP